jgi:general secretion pathway protein A
MYLTFFGLAEKPFSITPDPRYLYLSTRHADALAHLLYGINEAGGFIQLTGEVGTGKTTTIRTLLAQAPKDAEIALILNPRLSATEFLRTLCEELGVGVAHDPGEDTKDLVDPLNRYLLRAHAAGRRVVLIVDEAQNLSPEVLEQVRLLTNLETETAKLLQIILIGQPELRVLLARQELRQLAQRITGRYHLDPLSREETVAYVRHRLRVAGATTDLFTPGALREIHRISGGIPRVINVICDRALLGAYSEDLHQVPPQLVRRAGAEVFGQEPRAAWQPWLAAALAVAMLAGGARLLWPAAAPATASAPRVSGPSPPGHAGAAAIVPTAGPAQASLTAAAAEASGEPAPPATGPAAPTAGPGAPTLAQLITADAKQGDSDTAFETLFMLWNAHYVPGRIDGCSQALAQGLQCLMQRGSLAQLRLLNRPAILMLTDDAGAPFQVVLRALGPQSARLRIGEQDADVAVAELDRYWYGDFLLLWRPATRGAIRALSVGMHGAPVQQLRTQLARWSGSEDAASGGDAFDAGLLRLVEDFQRSKHLAVDGVAGMETLVALDAALASPDSPVLQPHPAQASTRGN